MRLQHYMLPLYWFVIANIGLCLLGSLSLSLLGLDTAFAGLGTSLADIYLLIFLGSGLGALALLMGSGLIVRVYLKARVVDESHATKIQQLNLIVARQARRENIRPPVLAIYDSPELNAFAVGTGQHNAMLVVSRSLVDSLTLDELSAVMGHEMTHITNGDMLALSFMQGTLNTWVEFPARILGSGPDKLFFGRSQYEPVYKIIRLLLLLCIGGMTHLMILWFSRQREFRADEGGAKLAGYHEMLAALRCLQADSQRQAVTHPLSVFGLNDNPPYSGIWRIFTSHPPLTERIRALSKVG